ncbi:prolyl aminopeptidase [Yunchengibacter salinarum]|uniref:prolyl aminopeptidase n=1 Tax=Yunchengibacter salinarum TaxID=3133399 RepID=UPI0035B57FA9
MRADTDRQEQVLYPPIEPFDSFRLPVGDGHVIHVERCGNPDGLPVLFVHGGPGGGITPIQRRFFDPARCHIILFDQRGCGQSRPFAGLAANTSWDLVADMEAIRLHLGIDRWVLFGGSWGVALSLLYALHNRDRVAGMVLRGIFLMSQRELDWFYGGGTGALFPEAYERFLAPLTPAERADPISAYHQRLTDDSNREAALDAARHWTLWESSTVTLVPDHGQHARSIDADFARAFARIEAHYFHHLGFLGEDDYLIRRAHRLNHIPTFLIQGRYDAICPPRSAWALAREMPSATLKMLPVAGHSAFEPPVTDALISAMNSLITSLDR